MMNESTNYNTTSYTPINATALPKWDNSTATAYEFDYELYLKYQKNRSVSDTTYWIILVAYTILIVMGSIGNLLVVLAVATNKGMWTARNIFIATLAVADSLLCLFAMPMTLVGILTKYWPFGPQTWLLCKVVRSAPAVTIFFSSYTMVVIAIDRQRFIVHSTKRQISSTEAIWISFGVLALSILISTPFIVISELKIMFLKPGAYDHIAFCAEDLSQWGQAIMSFSVVVVQYLVPCAIVTVCYLSICRLPNPPPMASNCSRRRIVKRRKKSNQMLIAVTITHFLSWLPLNVANVIITTFDSDKTPLFENIEHLFILYAICHWASMSSIILNPLLYGFMNGNFRNQFRKIWTSLKNCSRLKRSDSGINQSEGLALRLSRLNSTKRNGVECSEGLVTIHEDNSPEV